MANEWVSTKNSQTEDSSASKAAKGTRALKKTKIAENKVKERLTEITEELGEGLGTSAEETILHVKESHELDIEQQAQFDVLHSIAHEIRGRHDESLELLEDYREPERLDSLKTETRILVSAQLAAALNNAGETAEAKEFIDAALDTATKENVDEYLADLYLTDARINENLGEIDQCFTDADRALDVYRDRADWRGMAWSYHQMGNAALMQGFGKKALDYFNLALQMVGENSEPVVLGRVFADMSTVHWAQNESKKGIECLEKSIEFFSQTENEYRLVSAYNDLGAGLTITGDFPKAESLIEKSLELAEKLNYPHVAGILDSFGELKLLKGELEDARKILEKGINSSKAAQNELSQMQILRTLARIDLAEEKYDKAIGRLEDSLKLCEKVHAQGFENLIRIALTEAYLGKEEIEDCETGLRKIERNEPESDFFVLGNVQRLRGLLALKKDDSKTAVARFRKALTIFETRDDAYHKALVHFHIGEAFSEKSKKRAIQNFISSSEIFRKLGVKKYYNSAERKIKELGKKKKGAKSEESGESDSANTQLLMQRLAEATASRELLFREFVAILQQESKVGRMIIAESDEEGHYQPYLTDGYTPVESNQLVKELEDAIRADNLKQFAKTKNAGIHELRPPNAPPAVLLVYPKYSAKLNNGEKIEPLLRIVELGMDVCALREHDRDDRVEEEKNPFVSQSMMPGFIHSSPAMTKLVDEVYKIRSSDVTVLITGESGTGKEIVSRAIHAVSARKDKVFVPFNCTAVPKELTEGHLFGYKRGAFTGAQNDSPGMIKTADGGTLLLDEIGDLPIDVQPKLLRFLQEGEIQPLGEKRPFKVDVRVIAATNMDLEEKVKQGLFREDLYYRINVIRLRVPPLRERKSEIKPIVKYYVNHYSARFNKKDITIKPQTIDLLMVSDWEGNVRQLCNEIQRIVARARDGEVITPDHISPELKKKPVQKTYDESGNVTPIASAGGAAGAFSVATEGTTIEEAVSELETQMIIDSMRRNDGNITRVSKELGLTRRGLYMKIKRYGIQRAS